MNESLVNAVAEALLASSWPDGVPPEAAEAERTWAMADAETAAAAVAAWVAALPFDYTAADVLAEMRGAS